MNEDRKEMIGTILAARGYAFSLLHRLMMEEPTGELLAAASSPESIDALAILEDEEGAVAAMQQALRLCAEKDRLEAIRLEYTKLFLGPDKLIAPPWESCYATKERAIFQPSTLAVREWYRKYSYVPAGYPSHPDDHISLMMQFIALTTERAAQCLKEGLLCGCRTLLEGQKLFEENHLLNWMERYAQDMAQADTQHLYPQLTAAAARFVAYDHQVIEELLQAIGA